MNKYIEELKKFPEITDEILNIIKKNRDNITKEEKNKLKKSAEILNECFDLKNKSNRTINESLKLIEYCLEEFGSEK